MSSQAGAATFADTASSGRDPQPGPRPSLVSGNDSVEACPRYASSDHAIEHFASKTHAVGVRLHDDDSLDLTAPFGLDDIFSFRVTPNRAIDNRATHEEKAARAKRQWPEITVIPW